MRYEQIIFNILLFIIIFPNELIQEKEKVILYKNQWYAYIQEAQNAKNN